MSTTTDGGTVRLGFVADTSEFEGDLKKISDQLDKVNESGQGLGNSLDKNVGGASTKAAKKTKALTKETKASAKGLGDFTDSAGDADSVLQGLAGALDMVSPELAGVTRLVGDAAGGVEALSKGALLSGPVLATVAAAVAVLGGAYFLLQQDAAKAEEAMESAAKGATEAQSAYDSFRSTIDEVRESYQIFTGILDLVDVKVEESTAKIRKGAKEEIDLQRVKVLAIRKEVDALNESIQAKARASATKEDIAEQNKAIAQRDKLIGRLGKEQVALKKIEQVRDETIDQAEYEIRSKENLEQTTKALAAAEKSRAAQERKDTQARAEASREDALRASALVSLEKAEEAAILSTLSGREKLLEQQRREIANIQTIQAAHAEDTEVQAQGLEALQALKQQHIKDLWEYQTEATEGMGETEAQASARSIALFEQKKTAMVSASTELATAVEDATALILDNESAASAEAALRIFRINQAAALANIAIHTAQGISVAASLPPPVDVIKAGAVLATSSVAVAKVTSQQPPQFHMGGLAPDERDIRVTRGEGILNSTAMGRIGEEGLRELNRGEGSQAPIIVQNRYTHKAFDIVVQDNLRRVGSPLRAALRGDTKVGHKVRG